MDLTDIINLNVGGVSMSTYRSTLLADPGSSLAKMFQPDSSIEPARMHNGEFFLDADPRCFEVILNWLRYKRLMLPPTVTKESVAVLADFYCLSDLLELVVPPSKPPPSPLDKVLSKLEMVKLCDSVPLSQQILESGKWLCTSRYSRGCTMPSTHNRRVPYCKIGPLLEASQVSQADIRLRSNDLVITIDTALGFKLCLTPGNDTNMWANRFGLVLHLHHLEFITWQHCDSVSSIPESALVFSRTQSGLPRYLGFVIEKDGTMDIVTPGVVVGERGVTLMGRDHGPNMEGFYVLCTGKTWDL